MHISRRTFTAQLLSASGAILAAPALVRGQSPVAAPISRARPRLGWGVASGDVSFDSAVIWSRTDRPGRMIVEWATNEAFRDARRVEGPVTGPDEDFTAKTLLGELPAGAHVFYRVRFEGRAGTA